MPDQLAANWAPALPTNVTLLEKHRILEMERTYRHTVALSPENEVPKVSWNICSDKKHQVATIFI